MTALPVRALRVKLLRPNNKGPTQMNHPNRGRDHPSRNPTPAEIRDMREAAQLTQKDAGLLIHTTGRTWQQWEAGDRRMHPAFWELFRIKLKKGK